MTLNTESTTGLLGGHTWRYGAKDGRASFNLLTVLSTFAASFSGDHLSIQKYSFDIDGYIEEKFVFATLLITPDQPEILLTSEKT